MNAKLIIILILMLSMAFGNLSSDAVAADRRALAQRFAPILLLHPDERYFPMDPALYFEKLKEPKTEDFLTSGRELLVAGKGVPVLVNVSPDERSFQYWFFYPYNGCQQFRVQYQLYGPFRWGHQTRRKRGFELCPLAIHEGDWEHVTVRLDAQRENMESVFYSSHEGGLELPASAIFLEQGRPLVHVALGSHANFPAPLAFQPFLSIRDRFLNGLFGIEVLQFGDTVTGPSATPPWTWDTAQRIALWEDIADLDFAKFDGLWGVERDARTLRDAPALPGIAGPIIKAGTSLVMTFKAEMKALSRGAPPESPWVRTRWQDHDREPSSSSYNLPHGPFQGGEEGLDFDDSPALKSLVETQLHAISLWEQEGNLGICTQLQELPEICHGVREGQKRTLTLRPGDYVKQVDLAIDSKTSRIRAIRLQSRMGNQLEIGQWTGMQHSLVAPDGLQIGAWFGNEEEGLFGLGPVYIRLPRMLRPERPD